MKKISGAVMSGSAKNPIKKSKNVFFAEISVSGCVYYKITFQKIEKVVTVVKEKNSCEKNKYARKFREKERKRIETGNTK